VPPNDPDRVLLERLQAAEKRAAEEAELRQAEAVLRQAAEERATKEAEMRKKMEEAIGKARALEQATRWSSVATLASLRLAASVLQVQLCRLRCNIEGCRCTH